MNTQELREAAAKVIEERGWWRCGVGQSLDGACCAWVAMRDFVKDEDRSLALQAIHELGFKSTFELFDWNDAPGRTAEEVIALLRSIPGEERGRP